MTSKNSSRGRPRGGSTDKRAAMLGGALTVFARDGYTRASIDTIAEAAGVSTRTIYNHFRGKAELFEAVIQDSSARTAQRQIEVIDRHLRKVTDLETDLIEFGLEWAGPKAGVGEHFALVRQINAEAAHIPRAAIEAWQENGPLRVRRELAGHLRRLSDQGLLRIANADRAAVHLLVLVGAWNPSFPGAEPSAEEITEMVTTGVHAFLHGYG
ncbi:TetR/AcrR family transcriptional regulator [Allokutzneria albata]|uniref:DNA-binding transcriptional regulator, AcrR family n=1 Tax=Allokutzneria albata TaxID=211114 RepID=A0A1H0CD81_ALLAB|nr:TetR/AcrR family transcriptional regulator [Allokutzneria albata]SDN55828.1 DNA-binding transcriptional regulator, AcrR family [Allokutzneria albata]